MPVLDLLNTGRILSSNIGSDSVAFESSGDDRLFTFIYLIRFTKLAALAANAWTIVYIVLIVGWQLTTLLGSWEWPALPLSTVIGKLQHSRDTAFVTGSVSGIDPSAVDTLLRVPVLIPLLLASALLTVFYLWLASTEKRYLRKP